MSYALATSRWGYAIVSIARETDTRIYVDEIIEDNGVYINRQGWIDKLKVKVTAESLAEITAIVERLKTYRRLESEMAARHDQEWLELSRTFNPFHEERP